MERLPNELFVTIRQYSTNYDYHKLVNTSKLFTEIKYNTAIWRLNSHYSRELLTDPDFYQKILTYMKSPSKQLTLFLLVPRHFICISSIPWECHTLMVSSRYVDISSKVMNLFLKNFQGINTFELMDYRDSLETLVLPCQSTTLQHVRLIDCYEVHDISCLCNIDKLYLENIPNLLVIDSMKTKELIIVDCSSLFEVNNTFHTFQHLHFHSCDAILSTKGFDNIPNLVFYDCVSLVDISDLQTHEQVMIFACPNIRKYPEKLMMKSFVTDCFYLPNDIELIDPEDENEQKEDNSKFSMDFVHLIEKVELLKISNMTLYLTKPVQKLMISYCRNLHLIFASTAVCSDLVVDHVGQLNITVEGTVNKMLLKDCEAVNLNVDGYVQACEIRRGHKISFTKVRRLDSIHFIDTVGIGSLDLLEAVEEVKIKDCRTIRKIVALKKVKVVRIENCSSLSDISGLGENELVEIVSCKKLFNFESLTNVPKTKIVDCGTEELVEKTPAKKRKKKKFYHFN